MSIDRPRSSAVGPGEFVAGKWTYWDASARFMTYKPEDRIALGAFVSVSPGVRLVAGGNHGVRQISQYPFTRMAPRIGRGFEPQPVEEISVGSDVWIGADALLVGPLRIADGAIIGAGAVVTRDVGAYEIVAGVPARRIGARFPEADVERLLAIRWWDWSDEFIRANERALRASDMDALERLASEHATQGETS